MLTVRLLSTLPRPSVSTTSLWFTGVFLEMSLTCLRHPIGFEWFRRLEQSKLLFRRHVVTGYVVSDVEGFGRCGYKPSGGYSFCYACYLRHCRPACGKQYQSVCRKLRRWSKLVARIRREWGALMGQTYVQIPMVSLLPTTGSFSPQVMGSGRVMITATG